jgi:hypothetical protein
MKRYAVLASLFLAISVRGAGAGAVADGDWTPTRCGPEPQPVTLDLASVEAYNQSILAAKAWQQQANAYAACLVGEGNADNAAIVKAVNDAQQRIKARFDRLNADVASAQTKFGDRKAAPDTFGRTTGQYAPGP